MRSLEGIQRRLSKKCKSIIELIKAVPLRIFDDCAKELVIRIKHTDIVQDFGVELDEGNCVHLEVFLELHIKVARKGVGRRVSDARDVMDLSIESGESFIPADLTRGQLFLSLPVS